MIMCEKMRIFAVSKMNWRGRMAPLVCQSSGFGNKNIVMKHIVESVEELYKKEEPTGEAIIDEVVSQLRRTKTQRAADIALLMDVRRRDLSIAIELLTGIPLNDIVLEWRMLQAKDLLDDMSLSIGDVADRCGFRHSKNLIIAFRRRWGTTPQAYRTGSLSRNRNYMANRDGRSRQNALRRTRELKNASESEERQADEL